jgi:hypothetical protein
MIFIDCLASSSRTWKRAYTSPSLPSGTLNFTASAPSPSQLSA